MRLWTPILLLACQEYQLDAKVEPPAPGVPPCEWEIPPTDELPLNPICLEELPEGGFEPIVEWSKGPGRSCRALPAVGDLDGDGLPEVVANFTGLFGGDGDLVVFSGDGVKLWERDAALGYASGATLADLDGDGLGEILVTRKTSGGFLSLVGTFAVVAYDIAGDELWISDSYPNQDFDYASGIVVSDMDHDGRTEIVAGRVILNDDGTLRGKGNKGRGSWGVAPIIGLSEASVSAVADLDLDGVEEVVTGNARYSPDGLTIWHDGSQADGMIAIANLDDDPEGEVVISSFNTVRAQDTDGTIMWGPIDILDANIVSPAAIGDIDRDGEPEIVVAGGSRLVALNADGTLLWSVPVEDSSGATGASLFDFEGDGIPEVVYIDEVRMIAVDGATGAEKFLTFDHSSDTMMDYPVIADVDADDHAEIVVCHAGHDRALSVYGDATNSWRPARKVWNQHAYAITGIGDDLRVPADAVPSFQTHNTWHSANADIGDLPFDLIDGPIDAGAEILGICEVSCGADEVELFGRLRNPSPAMVPEGTLTLALYAIVGGNRVLIGVEAVTADVASGSTGGDVQFMVPIDIAQNATGFELVADDIGGGIGIVNECSEANNTAWWEGPLCD